VVSAIGLAAASAVGMAAGEYLGDATRNLRRAAVMGVATIIGTMGPVLPFMMLTKDTAIVVAIVLVTAISLAIARARPRHVGARVRRDVRRPVPRRRRHRSRQLAHRRSVALG